MDRRDREERRKDSWAKVTEHAKRKKGTEGRRRDKDEKG